MTSKIGGVAAGVAVLVLLGGGGTATYLSHQQKMQREAELQAQLAAERLRAEQEEARRKVVEALLDRMTEERVVADIVILDQKTAPDGKVWTQLRIHMKASPNSHESPRVFGPYTIEGDVVYFEAYVLRFEDQYIHARDATRGRALMLLTRVFGEHQAPADGFPVEDASGAIPHYYELGRPDLESAERELWQRFWWYTTHRDEAKRDGVEVAHGQAPFTKADLDSCTRSSRITAGTCQCVRSSDRDHELPLGATRLTRSRGMAFRSIRATRTAAATSGSVTSAHAASGSRATSSPIRWPRGCPPPKSDTTIPP